MQRPDFRADLQRRQAEQPPAPAIPAEVQQGLSPAQWRERILQLFRLDSTEILVLDRAVTALRRIRDAEALIDKEGLMLRGAPHPALRIEREQANLFRQLIKQLNFNGAEDEDVDGKIIPIRKEA
jgi:hypothetical protein